MISQLLINTIVSFSLTFFFGVGYVLVIQIIKINYFIQGAIVSFMGYISWFLFSFSQLDWVLVCLILVFIGVSISIASYLLIFKRFYDQKSSFSLMFLVSLSLVVILENMIQIIFGANVKVLNFQLQNQSFTVFNGIISLAQIYLIGSVILAGFVSFLTLYKTNLGMKWLALSQNRKLFVSLGFNLNLNIILVFAISGFLASITGICLSLERSLTPQVGTNLFLTAFVAASLANYELRFFWFGCLVIAVLKTATVWFLPSGWSDGLVFGLLGVWIVAKEIDLFSVVLSKAKHLLQTWSEILRCTQED
jgi:branched-subunit amino acid ABC-type transport system permease component